MGGGALVVFSALIWLGTQHWTTRTMACLPDCHLTGYPKTSGQGSHVGDWIVLCITLRISTAEADGDIHYSAATPYFHTTSVLNWCYGAMKPTGLKETLIWFPWAPGLSCGPIMTSLMLDR
jgi:hypothetical protein